MPPDGLLQRGKVEVLPIRRSLFCPNQGRKKRGSAGVKRGIGAAKPFLMICLFISLALAAGKVPTSSAGEDDGGLELLDSGWYRLVDGKPAAVDASEPVEVEPGEDLVLYYDGLSADDRGKVVCILGAIYRPVILVGEQRIYAYEDAEFPRNRPMRAKLYCEGILPADTGTESLCLILENQGDDRFVLPVVYVGSSPAIFDLHWMSEIPNGLISFAMLTLGLLAMGIGVYLRRGGIRDRRFMDIAWFLLICAVWCVLDSTLMQEVSGRPGLVCVLSFYAFMAMPIPVLNFVLHTGNLSRWRILRLFGLSYYLNGVVQGLVYRFFGVEFVSMLWVSHLLMVGGAAAALKLLLWERRWDKSRELRSILRAFALLGAGGAAALIVYWILEPAYYALIFQVGILVFIACLLISLTDTMVENFRAQTEVQTYKRLSQEDRLTGLQNRRAFEEFFVCLERDPAAYENVALVFMDLDHLKHTNDCFGHSAGDELIVAAAGAIIRTFGQEGHCYRIGGDEFAAVLPNPRGRAEAWSEALDANIEEYNQMGRYPLSIARGISYLRDETGAVKRISDWKYEADQAMYADKNRRQAEEAEEGAQLRIQPLQQ